MKKLVVVLFFIIYTGYAMPNHEFNVCASPEQTIKQCNAIVIAEINSAKTRIIIQGDSFFENKFSAELIKAKQRGVKIYIVGKKLNFINKYTNDDQSYISGQLALEYAAQTTPNSNLIMIDQNKLLIVTFSLLTATQKISFDYVLTLNNPELIQAYFLRWNNYLLELTPTQLAALKQKSPKVFVIPPSPNGSYFIYGKINNHEVQFLIDTGATVSVIPEYMAKALNIASGQAVIANTAAGKKTLYKSVVDRLQLGSLDIRQLQVFINPHTSQRFVLLGMNFLKHLDFYIYQGNLYLMQRSKTTLKFPDTDI